MTSGGGTAAAILAGGLARRLGGVNKASLRLGGSRIIDRQLTLLRSLAAPVFVVGGDPSAFADVEAGVVPDAIAGAGALGGIYTAIVASPHPRTLVVACDMPFLRRDVLERLIGTPGDLVIPHGTCGYEPLCAVYAKACAGPIRALIEQGNLRASAVPGEVRDTLEVVEMGPEVLAALDPDGRMFVNVNTPHDYERARGLGSCE